jgi:hypothetical protein
MRLLEDKTDVEVKVCLVTLQLKEVNGQRLELMETLAKSWEQGRIQDFMEEGAGSSCPPPLNTGLAGSLHRDYHPSVWP